MISASIFCAPLPLGWKKELNDLQGLTGFDRCSGELLWFMAAFPARPLFHLQLAEVRLDGRGMERWQNKKPIRHDSSPHPSSASESIDVASGPRPSLSQTTDTNWQHVSWFRNQTSSLSLETHLNPLSRVCIGKRQMRDSAVTKYCLSLSLNFTEYKDVFLWIEWSTSPSEQSVKASPQ